MPDHQDRYAAISEMVKKRIGRELDCFVIIAIDKTGELYYGADYGNNKSNQTTLLRNLRIFEKHTNDILVKTD